MSYRMYIDDLRNPPDRSWVVVRSVAAAQAYISEYGYPYLISFDHDLGMKDGKLLADGYDFAKWLVEQDMNDPWMDSVDFLYKVHSANPVGAANIYGYLNNYHDAVLQWGHPSESLLSSHGDSV